MLEVHVLRCPFSLQSLTKIFLPVFKTQTFETSLALKLLDSRYAEAIGLHKARRLLSKYVSEDIHFTYHNLFSNNYCDMLLNLFSCFFLVGIK